MPKRKKVIVQINLSTKRHIEFFRNEVYWQAILDPEMEDTRVEGVSVSFIKIAPAVEKEEGY